MKKRLEQIEKSNLGRSPFYNGKFYWNTFHKSSDDRVGYFFRMKQVRLMCERDHSLLIQ